MKDYNLDLRNQDGYFNPDVDGDVVHVIGVGATGSFVVGLLARMGLSQIHVYDGDVIEDKNIQNQNYSVHDVGRPKVEAIAERTNHDVGAEVVIPHNTMVESIDDFELDGSAFTVFLLTDSVESRLKIAEMLEDEGECQRVIETRLAIGHIEVHTFDPVINDNGYYDKWRKSLDMVSNQPDDDFTEVSPCGSPLAIGHVASFLASLTCEQYLQACKETQLDAKILIDLRANLIVSEEK